MKRILSALCVVAMLLGMLPMTVLAAGAETGKTSFHTLQDAVDSNVSETIVLTEDTADLVVSRDVIINLNGHSIAGVTVKSGVTLQVMDSETDDYTVADGIYGKLTNISGSVEAADGYVKLAEGAEVSFHRVDLELSGMTLRPGRVGVYYSSDFSGDEVVAAAVESYGVALNILGEPNASNMNTTSQYSVLRNFAAGKAANAANGTLLHSIMLPGNSDAQNAQNSETAIYGRAYIKTADGYIFGNAASRDLKTLVEAIDGMWSELSDNQQAAALDMYEIYKNVMGEWSIPHIILSGDMPKIDIPVNSANGVVTEEVTVEQDGVIITVPFGALLEEGVEELTLTVGEKASSDSGVEVSEDEELVPMDVHVKGLSPENTAPLTIYLGKVMPENLNMGNYRIYHVEADGTHEMELVANDEEFTAHNQYKYTLDGELTLHMASFSEATLVYSEDNAWNGVRDYDWYDAEATELYIRNADQLAGLSAIVGGMDGQTQDSFENKTIKLLADISFGDLDSENGVVFYPIGYYNTEYKYEKTGTDIDSGFQKFKGTFDGNGNTISDFYQNTWEMKGDHNWYDATLQYYRDGMGLFGKVYGGTVKNLTVKNFSSDGEITTTGTIAAYADAGATFENISIFDCNPRVYNIGNGGIVGCVGWYANDADMNKVVTFKNITVDNSNKISALWGSWDVACGGIVGQYYPTSGQSNAIDNAGLYLENCHIAAQIDVYNDVCANYQYYAYRYAGILIGSVRENETINGHVYPNMDGITAKDCTVHFGDWNDYYYCELVANSLASYTHDHQMSRLEQVLSVDVEEMRVTSLKGEITDIPTSGRVNYVVVKAKDANNMWIHGDGENYATCYHFVNGKQHFHNVADDDNPTIEETVNGEIVLKEDKQIVYREFNNLVTGYGWGVTSKGLEDFKNVVVLDNRKTADSIKKFAAKDTAFLYYIPGQSIKLGDIFEALPDLTVDIKASSVYAAASPAAEGDKIYATFTQNETDWTQSTLTFDATSSGDAKLIITDYYYCTSTVVYLQELVGDFYIVGKYSNGNYYRMNGELWLVSDDTTRFQSDNIGADPLPQSVPYGVRDKMFTIEKTDKGTYKIYNNGKETEAKYLGGSGGSDGAYVIEADAAELVLEMSATLSGAVNIKKYGTDNTYLCKSLTTPKHISWYTPKENSATNELIMIPAELCEHKDKVTQNDKEATCTEAGYTGDEVCVNCGELVASGEEIPATNHNYTSSVTTKPECDKEGVITYTCQNDASHTYEEPMPALEHVFDNELDQNCNLCDAVAEGFYKAPCPGCGATEVWWIPYKGGYLNKDVYSGKHYYLTEDVVGRGQIHIGENATADDADGVTVTVCLDLHGHNISKPAYTNDAGLQTFRAFAVYSGSTLSLMNTGLNTGMENQSEEETETASEEITGGEVTASYNRDKGGVINLTEGSNLKVCDGVTLTGNVNLIQDGDKATKNQVFKHGGGAISVGAGGTVTVAGGVINGQAASYGGAIYAKGGNVIVTGGTINGGTVGTRGGAIYVTTNGSVTVEGGTINGGIAERGGTIAVANGALTVFGGTINGGTAIHGGAIYATDGTFNLSGGTINGGTATVDSWEKSNSVRGGAVYLGNNDFTMTGGTISGGKATYTNDTTTDADDELRAYGGNLYINNGQAYSAKISDGTISGGTASNGNGGNIYLNAGELIVSGGTITGGSAQRELSRNNGGGNIYTQHNTTLEIDGGTITKGVSEDSYGGNILTRGTTTITGGTISEGSAPKGNGGNIAMNGFSSTTGIALNISGGTIKNGSTAIGKIDRTNSGEGYLAHDIYVNCASLNITGGQFLTDKTNGYAIVVYRHTGYSTSVETNVSLTVGDNTALAMMLDGKLYIVDSNITATTDDVGEFVDSNGEETGEDLVWQWSGRASIVAGTWQLVTDISELTEGSQIVIAAANQDLCYALGAQGEVDAGVTDFAYRQAVNAVKKSGNTIAFGSDVTVFTVKNGHTTAPAGSLSFQSDRDVEGTAYYHLQSGRSGSNKLQCATYGKSTSWIIEINDQGEVTKTSNCDGRRGNIRFEIDGGIPMFNCNADNELEGTFPIAIYKWIDKPNAGVEGDSGIVDPTDPTETTESQA